MNLLDWDDAPTPATPVAAAAPTSSAISFIPPEAEIGPPRFQALWAQTPEALNARVYGHPARSQTNTQAIETVLRQHMVYTLTYIHTYTNTYADSYIHTYIDISDSLGSAA